jgi:hypothetical protein
MTCRKSPSLHISINAQSLSLAVVSFGLTSTTSILPAQAAPLKTGTAIPAPQNLETLAPGVLTPGYPLANGHFLQGLKLKHEGKKSLALVEFLQAVKENPRFTQALYEQALIFREKGFTKLALSALSQAIKIDPSFKDARLLSATIKLESGDTLAAQSELSAGLGLPALSMVSSTKTTITLPSKTASTTPTKGAGATITFGNNNQAMLAQPGRLKTMPSATTRAAIKADDATCVAPFPGNLNSLAARQENSKNRLSFTPDTTTSKGSGITNNLEAYSNLKVEKRSEEDSPEDEWVSKLRYLAKNGTTSLRPGEAFMFAEDSGEAVLFLSNGQKIRRIIAKPKDKQTIVKERRPDMLLPQDVMIKLSTLGKLVAQDPARALEIATDTELQKILASPPATKKNQDTYGDYHDNNFLESPYLKESELERNSAKAIDARLNKNLNDSPFADEGNSSLPNSASSSKSKKGSELTSILDAEGKSNYLDDYKATGNKENLNSEIPNGQTSSAQSASASKSKAGDPLKEFENELPADSFMEKTQKFFSWIRKSLNF